MKAEALIGRVLGTCTLQRLVGQGGMGAVFLAQQSRPRRQVAVKVLLPMTELAPAQHAAFLERFRRETDAAASLVHTSIMPVHEYGEQDGLAYLVMPYISGGTLRDELEKQGSLPLTNVAFYLDQMADALDFAHTRGIIHRDVKPANILKTLDGRLLLSDFGLVKIVAEEQTEQSRLTGNGAMPLGTPDYMAPEQALSGPVDARSDLYSLGVVLYHMVTGDVPFKGDTPMQVAMQHVHLPPSSPRQVRTDLPVAAEQVILRALAKNPAQRYDRASEMAAAFRQALLAAGVRLIDTPMSAAQEQLEGGRSFKARGLFDPLWRSQQAENDPAADSTVATPAVAGGVLKRVHSTSAKLNRVLSSFAKPMPSLVKNMTPLPESSVPLPSPALRGLTPLPPTPLKLTPKREGPSMFQKHRMHSLTPKTPEEQAPSLSQHAPANSASEEGPPSASFPTQRAAAAPQNWPPVDSQQLPAFKPGNGVGQFGQPQRLFAGQPGTGPLGNPAPPPFGANATRQLGEGAMPPPFTPTNATRQLSDPGAPASNTNFFPVTGTTGAFPAIPPGATGALMIPNYDGQGMTGTMKLTQSVKVVQVPVAGQPGRYMTGFLPVIPATPEAPPEPQGPMGKLKKNLHIVAVLCAVLMILAGSGLFFLLRPHSQPMATKKGGPQGPNVAATATGIAEATVQANIILEDPLTAPIHNWPQANTGSPQYIFKDGAYHVIVNDSKNSALPLLPDETFNGPMAYTVTTAEVKGDDGSPYNWFGIVLRYNDQRNGKNVKTFYCFDYEPMDGIYQFRKYDGGYGADASPWADIWHAHRGNEFHTGHGENVTNTLKVFANGQNFTFYVNGKQVGTARDNSLSGGQIGMIVNKQGAEIAYSNLVLTNN